MGFKFGVSALRYPPQPAGNRHPNSPPPLIVFLHGIGERGGRGELDRVATWGLPRLRAAGWCLPDGSFPFEVVAPQCPKNRAWCDDDMLASLEDWIESLLAEGRIDRRRVYLTGFSMGGMGAFCLALRRPDQFAAIAPVCGRCLSAPHLLTTLSEVPFWIAYAEDDEIQELATGSEQAFQVLAPFGKSQRRVYRLGAQGGTSAHVRTCERAYREPALYQWLAKHTTRDERSVRD